MAASAARQPPRSGRSGSGGCARRRGSSARALQDGSEAGDVAPDALARLAAGHLVQPVPPRPGAVVRRAGGPRTPEADVVQLRQDEARHVAALERQVDAVSWARWNSLTAQRVDRRAGENSAQVPRLLAALAPSGRPCELRVAVGPSAHGRTHPARLVGWACCTGALSGDLARRGYRRVLTTRRE
jgi:hypothetical protein